MKKFKLWLIGIMAVIIFVLLSIIFYTPSPGIDDDLPATTQSVIRHGIHVEPTREDLLEARIAWLEYWFERAEREIDMFVCFEEHTYVEDDGRLYLEVETYEACKIRAYFTEEDLEAH